jgi:o-succinylbenzoate synthase
MTKASINILHHPLIFKKPARTSRDVLTKKPSWFIKIETEEGFGIGECSIIPGLNPESTEDAEMMLKKLQGVNNLENIDLPEAHRFPSVRFAIETALRSLAAKNPMVLFESDFTENNAGIPINGLVWMDNIPAMREQMKERVEQGYDVVKLKIGALDFDQECDLLDWFRNEYGFTYELRLDANGAFTPAEALRKIERLAQFDIHSIEQPIKSGQIKEMRELVKHSDIAIALDEELIGIADYTALLDEIAPQFMILKPSLIGGWEVCDNLIKLAQERNINWWATSALESNIGLNAIAQWCATQELTLPQGLGTGSLYTNNIPSPLSIERGHLYSDQTKWTLPWD